MYFYGILCRSVPEASLACYWQRRQAAAALPSITAVVHSTVQHSAAVCMCVKAQRTSAAQRRPLDFLAAAQRLRQRRSARVPHYYSPLCHQYRSCTTETQRVERPCSTQRRTSRDNRTRNVLATSKQKQRRFLKN